jgi:hypothetical protein
MYGGTYARKWSAGVPPARKTHEVLEVRLRMFAPSIGRVGKPHRWGCFIAPRPVVAHIRP